MVRAFNAQFLVTLTLYTIGEGFYDEDNIFREGSITSSNIKGRLLAGNKFKQFSEGLSQIPTEGGDRVGDFWELYVTNSNKLTLKDKIGYEGSYFNVLQRSNLSHFGFNKYILERSTEWSPT